MPQHFHIAEGGFHLHLHHVVDELLIAGALRPAQEQLHCLAVLADVVHHPVDTVRGFYPHMLRLLFLGQLSKGGLGLHEPAHQCLGVGFYNRGK